MLMLGDCIDKLKTLRDCSVDAVVTDPPYGLAFMGKKWDYDVPAVEVWAECLRVLKPGGHLLAFAGTRTQHRMAVRIEDAGFEIRDMIAWVYGSGFPKSLDVSKAIDKAAGAEREVIGSYKATGTARNSKHIGAKPHAAIGDYETDVDRIYQTAPATPEARQWQGWGTSLKPALEPITVARKPLIGTVAENVLKHGTGGINVDACRVGYERPDMADIITARSGKATRGQVFSKNMPGWKGEGNPICRWPANLIHDGSDEVVGLFPDRDGGAFPAARGCNAVYGKTSGGSGRVGPMADSGSAARFFYCAKASKADREAGCDGLEFRTAGEMVDREEGSAGIQNPRAGAGRTGGGRNGHPTVKPCALMRYLCRLVTPPGGIVLDPFMGSGSTGKGAILEGFRFIGIERDPDYMQIAESRINHAQRTAMETKDVPHQLELEVASA